MHDGESRGRRYWCEWALLPDTAESHRLAVAASPGVVLEERNGVLDAVHPEVPTPPAGAEPLRGLTLPGFANAHSHAFHRALRGRTSAGAESFWGWRETMYRVAGRLTPESYYRLARAVYAEMACAGITCVGEFHYLHHTPGGTPYTDPNAMGTALLAAAQDAGVRITLLDTCYLHGGLDTDGYQPLRGVQHRFSDGSVHAWADRVARLAPTADHARIATAVHSVRALNRAQLTELVRLATDHRAPGAAVDWGSPHIHLSEQPAENAACRAVHGRSPTQLLADTGLLDRLHPVLVHATHLTDTDLGLLRHHQPRVCLCPTTERDLADGLPRLGELAPGRIPLVLGTDGHSTIDMIEEARAAEMNERLRTGHRGTLPAASALTAATTAGHAALGWPDAGHIAAGYRADLVTLDLTGVRTAGLDPARAADMVLAAAGTPDVTDVFVDGRRVVHDRTHQQLPNVAHTLDTTIKELLA
ncbi:formimidoylglutamate deiminase [Lipingzhangella sp. LS1_29]|uniref:Formimidoylglutamate deiminase n=1 Tax=Lipingzhangella rawalii TaxID=2055835 RepID=A0ABU2H0A6_9ACTN|nr:formimidoylglutamate deiminase [Lipingzhangella rawalii]MDS1268743.1 formimidoylglutamate deiminase [Lipingzhangella rawalii]